MRYILYDADKKSKIVDTGSGGEQIHGLSETDKVSF